MKALGKIENILNKIVEKIAFALRSILKLITPKTFQQKIKNRNEKVKKKKAKIDSKLSSWMDRTILIGEKSSLRIRSYLLHKFSFLIKKVQKVRDYDYASLTPKKTQVLAIAFISPIFLKAQKWIISLKSTTVAGAIITTTITTLCGIQVYKGSKEIVEKREKQLSKGRRNIASIGKERPRYYRSGEKQFNLYSVALPIYHDGGKSHRPVKMDITLEFSNRYLKAYFEKVEENEQGVIIRDHSVFLQDYINTKVLPVIPKFIFEKEGKMVVKDKIKNEVNKLIRKRGIKGEVKEVYLNYLLSS